MLELCLRCVDDPIFGRVARATLVGSSCIRTCLNLPLKVYKPPRGPTTKPCWYNKFGRAEQPLLHILSSVINLFNKWIQKRYVRTHFILTCCCLFCFKHDRNLFVNAWEQWRKQDFLRRDIEHIWFLRKCIMFTSFFSSIF